MSNTFERSRALIIVTLLNNIASTKQTDHVTFDIVWQDLENIPVSKLALLWVTFPIGLYELDLISEESTYNNNNN